MRKRPIETVDDDTDPEDLAERVIDGLKRKVTVRDLSAEERVEFYWELSRLAQDQARAELHSEREDDDR